VILVAQSIQIPRYNIMHMQGYDENEFITWLQDHYAIHLFLRGVTNVGGVDLSYFDLKSPEAFQIWQEDHLADHRQFDQFFGTT
jgi:hypothetical protein